MQNGLMDMFEILSQQQLMKNIEYWNKIMDVNREYFTDLMSTNMSLLKTMSGPMIMSMFKT